MAHDGGNAAIAVRATEPAEVRGINDRIQLAEAEARSRDCLGVYLDSIDFQAPGFYVKQGYQVFGVLDDFPPGSRQTYFCKRLGIDVG